MKALICTLIFLSFSAFAVSEKVLGELLPSTLYPFFQAQGKFRELTAPDGLRLSTAAFIHEGNAKASIVLLTGRSESYKKYVEVIYDLYQRGYDVYTMDHRGQGYSERLLANPQIGYVHSYKDYLSDFTLFMNEIVLKENKRPLYLLTHSMGGAIASLYLIKHSDIFKAALLSSPMLDLDTGKYSHAVARAICEAEMLLGKGDHYAVGKTDYDPDWSFEENDVTHSPERFELNKKLLNEEPSLRLGGPSFRWVAKSLDISNYLQRHADKIQTRITMLQSGADQIIKAKGQNRFCERAPLCHKVLIPGAGHELMMEKDELRQVVFKELEKLIP